MPWTLRIVPLIILHCRGGGDGKYDQPYRMYNSDIFEYELDSPMTLYGTIPFMQAQKKDSTVGVFWLNAAELWVDIDKSTEATNPLSFGTSGATSTRSHWFFESGLIDVFVMLGPTPRDVSNAYGELTGYTQLPQQFAIAYHQCRWNYVTDQDVRDVDRKFDRHNIPYDVIWLDIDYLDDKQYFMWNPLTFSDPLGMQEQLDEHSRKLVAIIDPHVKRKEGYYVHDEMKSKDLAVKNSRGDEWEGHCWPGASLWVDCFNPAAIEWWKSLFRYDRFKGSMQNTFIWNDMNEPSVMNGPEHSMPRDNIHHGDWEHRDIHNLNGLTFHNATYQAMATRDDFKNYEKPTIRPFVLTRSFFAGSQRLGAMWTGDNQAIWSHLAAALPMILNNGISGYPFSGADVGGFMGNPSSELLARWYQAGSFYPFFRAHAHIDTKRREPYLIQEPYKRYVAQAIRLRYSLLPAWYTAFHTASVEGVPIVRPMWWQHPGDEQGFAMDDQMYLGDTGLLVKPVTEQGKESVDIHLPAEESPAPYYDYFTYTSYRGPAKGGSVSVAAPLDTLPLLMRAGHIIPRRDRPRRSSGLMANDPFTLVITLDPAKVSSDSTATIAEGSLYHDDGQSYMYENGARIHRQFTFTANGLLRSKDAESDPTVVNSKTKKDYLSETDHLFVEKIILVGVPDSWTDGSEKSAKVKEGGDKRKTEQTVLEVQKGTAKTVNWAVVKMPRVKVGRDWEIAFS